MMTDGIAGYPGDSVNRIKAAPEIMAKMKFKAVAYGGGSDALKNIAINLNGEFFETIMAYGQSISKRFYIFGSQEEEEQPFTMGRKRTRCRTSPIHDNILLVEF